MISMTTYPSERLEAVLARGAPVQSRRRELRAAAERLARILEETEALQAEVLDLAIRLGLQARPE